MTIDRAMVSKNGNVRADEVLTLQLVQYDGG